MRKLIIILSVLTILSLVGCTPQESSSQIAPVAVVKQPQDDTVNGYRVSKPQSSSGNETKGSIYLANKNSKTFHYSTCSYAKRIKEENLYKTSDREELLLEDFKPCSNCNP